jgi:hypothetical protein
VRVEPSVVIANSHWPRSIRSAASRSGLQRQEHNAQKTASDDDARKRGRLIMMSFLLEQDDAEVRSSHADTASVKDTHVETVQTAAPSIPAGVRVHFLHSDPIFTTSILLKLSACR